jgi:hypothetical protein
VPVIRIADPRPATSTASTFLSKHLIWQLPTFMLKNQANSKNYDLQHANLNQSGCFLPHYQLHPLAAAFFSALRRTTACLAALRRISKNALPINAYKKNALNVNALGLRPRRE